MTIAENGVTCGLLTLASWTNPVRAASELLLHALLAEGEGFELEPFCGA